MLKKLFGKNTIPVNLKIEGMHCQGCSGTLSAVLSKIDGVEKNNVSLNEKMARISLEPGRVSVEEVIREIEEKTSFKVLEKISPGQ